MKQITVDELKLRMRDSQDFELLDVRESYEHEQYNIGGKLAPLSELFEHTAGIPRDKEVIVYCRLGIRSQIAIQRLERKFGLINLINLKGGIEAWKSESSEDKAAP